MTGSQIAASIAEYCKKNKITIAEFMRRSNMKTTMFYHWRLNRMKPSKRMIERMNKAMSEKPVLVVQFNKFSLISRILKTNLTEEDKVYLMKLLIS